MENLSQVCLLLKPKHIMSLHHARGRMVAPPSVKLVITHPALLVVRQTSLRKVNDMVVLKSMGIIDKLNHINIPVQHMQTI